jgi:voltage-gated potassium channel
VKTIAILSHLLKGDRGQKANLVLLARFCILLAAVITAYSVLFHWIMLGEGRSFSWITGFYWTFTTMTTLGYGDITFEGDLGKAFAIIVMLSGVFMLLVMLPFTFVEYFYAPWMRAQSTARAPRELSPQIQGHVLITELDPVTEDLVHLLERHGISYAIIVTELNEALRLHDRGLSVMVGAADDIDTWRKARVEQAAMVVATSNERANTNVTFTVRELDAHVPVISSARTDIGQEVLGLAGASEVVRLGRILGAAIARRTHGGDSQAHVIGTFDDVVVAESLVRGTPLVGKTIREAQIRQHLGITVACVFERGRVALARADTLIGPDMALVLVGTQDQIDAYDIAFSVYRQAEQPVLILGGGRVGRAVAQALDARGVPWSLVERDPTRVTDPQRTIVGDATDPDVLQQAGLDHTSTVVVTTRDDDTNIFATICCRRLRPELEIIARSTSSRNITTLHRAGADLVLSYAAMGANLIFNRLRRQSVMHVAEGLDLVAMPITPALAGKTLLELNLPNQVGCLAVAMRVGERASATLDPSAPLPASGELIVVGDAEAERVFADRFR